jgi:hypothetical protein
MAWPARLALEIKQRLFWALLPKKWKRRHLSDIAEGQDRDRKSSHCQPECSL